MTTARAIIQDAFESIRVYSPGEQCLDADLARGLVTLNDMQDSWSNEALACFAFLEQSVTFTPGKFQYSIGVGADIDTVRPLRLRHGFGAAYVLDTTGNRYPLDVKEQDWWNLIGNISQVNANIPRYLFYDPQMPWGVLNFYPIPNIGYTAFWDSYLAFTRFPSLDTSIEFPPGYDLALKRNLGLALEPFYPNAIISQHLIISASESKGNIKRTNFKAPIAQYDSALVSKSRATYNIYRDTT